MPDDLTPDAESAGTLLTDQPADAPKPDADGAGDPKAVPKDKETETPAKDAKPADADAWELTAPEGYPLDAAGLTALTTVCKDAQLNKDQAEAVLKYMAGNYSQWQERQAVTRREWLEEFKADKDFGGDKYEASVAEARKALAAFDQDGSIRAMLNETGYGDNPQVLRIFARVGRALGEDRLTGGRAGGAAEKALEDRFYPNM